MSSTKPFKLKAHPSERIRDKNLFTERWTNANAARIGFRTGQGRTSRVIAEELADGTLSATVRAMWRKWQLPHDGKAAPLVIPISEASKALLAKRAAAEGLTPEVWCAKVLSFAIRDGLYNAIVGK